MKTKSEVLCFELTYEWSNYDKNVTSESASRGSEENDDRMIRDDNSTNNSCKK